jgi:putative acetyltransferase
MTVNLEIRESAPGDIVAIEALYPHEFPDEDLLPLVRDLLAESSATLSLVGTAESSLVGHVLFTKCRVAERSGQAALLGPLVVALAWQRRGIGSALVNAGIGRLKDTGVSQIFVLGDPAYYGRLGFRSESLVTPPYELPPEWNDAWQSRSLNVTATPLSGKLLLPRPWLQPALWTP